VCGENPSYYTSLKSSIIRTEFSVGMRTSWTPSQSINSLRIVPCPRIAKRCSVLVLQI